jgi:putative transposase
MAAEPMLVVKKEYGAKYADTLESLTKDRSALGAFYDFPAKHWNHGRTTNPIARVFATVRHRTVRIKGARSQITISLAVFKLIMAASKIRGRLQGEDQLPRVIRRTIFRDGIEVTKATANRAASSSDHRNSDIRP